MKRNRKGFSLVELIVVLVIMAIIAALCAPNISAYVQAAKVQNYQTVANNLTDELQTQLPQSRYWNWDEVQRNAISSIVRLADMGVAPYLISNSVVGIVAQRLVRKVCQFCKYEEPATADDIAIVGDGIPMITRGKGCKVCNNTGYKGRISIHEMVYIDKTLKRMIAKSADSQEMLEYAKKTQGMRSLLDSAIDLVKEGVTTPEEVMKIAYYSD